MRDIKKGFDEGVRASRQLGAEFAANPGESRKEYVEDAAWYFGEGKTYATLTEAEKTALSNSFAEGFAAERKLRRG